jgi:hypothetical protein
MKQELKKFANSLISREQAKKIKGGDFFTSGWCCVFADESIKRFRTDDAYWNYINSQGGYVPGMVCNRGWACN